MFYVACKLFSKHQFSQPGLHRCLKLTHCFPSQDCTKEAKSQILANLRHTCAWSKIRDSTPHSTNVSPSFLDPTSTKSQEA